MFAADMDRIGPGVGIKTEMLVNSAKPHRRKVSWQEASGTCVLQSLIFEREVKWHLSLDQVHQTELLRFPRHEYTAEKRHR